MGQHSAGDDTDHSIRRSIDWTPGHLLVIVLATLTAAIHGYIGLTTGETQFVLLGLALFAGVVVFFTVFWQPILYLVGAVYVTTLLVVWVLSGMQFFALGVVDAVVQLALVGTFLYLFVLERRHASS
ncbi:hypothetical protein [Natronosalvus vescus]|uniref:hypothetical protein n=1 Tax=Natronosalvus vescus TaxID=2953881 RepID=UPI0020913409|nr:hypothetical protein [Natronosalvus vescus]